jgi:ATP synthase protein I
LGDPEKEIPRDGRPDARWSLERDMSRLARREPTASVFWRSMSVLGTVGWSIVLPAAAGAWFGHRLDQRFESGVHFTLILLFIGVTSGSVIAWRVVGEHRK